MFERDVTIALNADVSNYTSSLSQAIAITQQYSSAADSALGNLAKFNSAMVSGLTKLTSGLTGPQRMVTDTAAAYQQQLSGLQSAAAVTGQNFGELEKSTRSLARSFPIGMGQAVQQVQALQSAGVTSNKEIERLAVSFTKLGAANNSFGPELGQQMLQVTRAFGNGTAQIDALGDSLTTVSKRMGASASGILTFSKAMAPIASTVGMSQTAVMGLSAAMSRLGEDGFLAANSFQKVLLDMNRGIRDGGPELKVYADLLNMTSDSLRKMADQDPTEVLIRFTEAIAKAGPDVQRTLDALGLDGVRTTRSITALARSGNLREAVNTAVGGYGDGSTDKAAEEVFSGVNDQMTMLSESMKQTVASAGKPYLSFMEDVLKAGRAVSEVTNKVMQNNGVQTLATAGIVGGVGAGLLFKGLAATSIGSMVMNLFRSGRDSAPVRDFQQARMDARTTGVGAPAGSGVASRLGGLIGVAQGPPPAPGQTGATIRERVNQTIRTATGAAGRLMDADRNNMATARGAAAPVPMTPAGAALRASIGDIARNRDMASLQAAGAATRNYMGSLAATGGMTGLAARGGLYVAEGARTAATGIRAATMGAGRALGSIIPAPLAAVAGVGIAGYLGYQQTQQNDDRFDRIRSESTTDIFASFNAFAEAAGQAGKGLVNFSAAVTQATNNLAKRNTTLEQATTLSAEEAAQAMSAGYEPGFQIVGEARRGGPGAARAITQQALALLGPRPDNESISRVVTDVASQTNTQLGEEVGRELYKALSDGASNIDVSSMISDIIANASQGPMFLQTSEEAAQLSISTGRALAGQSYRVSSLYGEQAGQLSNLVAAESLYNQARDQVGYDSPLFDVGPYNAEASRRREGANNIAAVLGSALNLSPDQMNAVFGETPKERAETFANLTWEQLEKRIRDYGEETGDVPSVVGVMDQRETLGDDFLASFKVPTELEKSSYTLEESFNRVTGVSTDLSTTLYGVNDAARAAELTLAELSEDPTARSVLSQDQQLVLDAISGSRDSGTVTAAAQAIARDVFDQAGGDISVAQGRLTRETANAMVDSPTQLLLQAALKQLELLAAPEIAATSASSQTLRSIRMGRAAQQMGPQSDPAQEDIRLGEMQAGAEAEAGMIGSIRNFMLQKAQFDQQMRQAREQAGLQMGQMSRDYNISVARANEDFRTQEFRAERDFNIQSNRQQKDFRRDRQRAREDFDQQEEWGRQDFNRQERNATADHKLSLARMERDYGTQVTRTKEQAAVATARAERDYQKAVTRSTRDFNLQLTRMESDYQLQRNRATEDQNKALARANEDYTRQRLRAQRDFNKQQEYAERDFFKSRTRSTEDFNKQMRRLVEDQAKSLYDPYKRIQAQLVMDGGQLLVNLADQNRALAEQMSTLDQLRASGLSQQSIDVLGLADSKNAQQAARLLADSMTDPSLIAQLNEQIAGRIDLTQMFVTSEDNVQTRRMAEDFALQMARMGEDFTSASQRATEQFDTAMSDMAEDYSTQMARAGEDFTTAMERMATDYATAVSRARDDQAQALADMAEDHATALADAAEDLARVLLQMQQDYETAVADAGVNFATAMARMQEEYAIAVARSRALFYKEMDRQAEDFARMRRRAQRDFARQMADAEADFRKMLARMAQDYGNALSDMGASLALAEKHALESLIGFGQNAASGQKKILRDFAEFIATLTPSQRANMSEQMRSMVQYLAETFPAMYRRYFPNGIAGIILGGGRVPTPAERDEGAGPMPPRPPQYSQPIGPGAPGDPYSVGGVPESRPWYDQWKEAGEESWRGYTDGLSNLNPAKWITVFVNSVIDAVKDVLGIRSPSRVFEDLGEDTIDGFVKGIKDTLPNNEWIKGLITGLFNSAGTWLSNVDKWIGDKIGDKWDELKANMPDVGKAVRDLFTDPGKFFTDLKTWIPQKLGKGWDKITADLPDVGKAVKTAFTDPGQFLTDLKTWIPGKIEKGWNKLTSGIPSGETIKKAVQDAFKQAGNWLGNFDTWLKEALPGWAKFTGAFRTILIKPMEYVVNELIRKWNSFQLKLGPLKIEVAGQTLLDLPVITIDTPDMDPVKWFAEGGIVSGAQVVGVGEAGPEAIIPLNQRGAEVMANALKTYLDETVWAGSLGGMTGGAQVINVEMADINIDLTDSGSEFSQQARELLQRVKDAALEAGGMMQASGASITDIINDLTEKLEGLAEGIADAFSGTASDVEEDTRSIAESLSTMADTIDTDLTDLTSGFETAVTSIIAQTDKLIAEAIQRIEDFANTDFTPPGGDPGGDPGDDPDEDSGGPGDTDRPGSDYHWNFYQAGYENLQAPAKTFLNQRFGGKALTEEGFADLTENQQAGVASLVYQASLNGGVFSESDKARLNELVPIPTSGGDEPGGGRPGTPGAPTKPDTSFKAYSTLQSALGKSDQDFLTQAFGGTAPTSKTWNKVTVSQREALIKALEDKNLTSDERKDISKLSLPNLSGGGGGGETGSPDPEVKQWWDVFREGYRKLGDNDKKIVDKIFGGTPTWDGWASLTETQQRRLRDAVRDGALDKDEAGVVKDINPYTLLGKQMVELARTKIGKPYVVDADGPDSFDCSGFTHWVYKQFGKNIVSYSDTQFAGGRNVTGEEMPGDLVFFATHPNKVTGHVGLYIGGGQMIDAPQPGDVVSINRATSRGDYKGARRYFAEGGIVNRRQEAVIGEAGPEVVVPLNDRGAEYFANVMQRYAAPTEARQAMVSPYSTPVSVSINQTYDNRTMFTGPIEVAANNPDEMAAKVAAKQRRQRLSQPVGSGR